MTKQTLVDGLELPTFLELAENQLSWANRGQKTINIKIAINTARMMVDAEKVRAALQQAPTTK